MNRSFFIAGVQFRPAREIHEAALLIKEGDRLGLVPEPTNKYDPNAVQIEYNTETADEIVSTFLGYVPKKFSAEVSAMLEAGVKLECIVEVINPSTKPWEMCKVVVREVSNEGYEQDGPDNEDTESESDVTGR